MLYVIVPRDKMGAAMGIYGLGIIFGPAIGPTLGGYLVEYVNWRLIFFIQRPGRRAGRHRRHAAAAEDRTQLEAADGLVGLPHHRVRPVRAAARVLRGQSWGWTGYG